MTAPLTILQLAAIEGRHAAATGGTWYLQPNYGPHFVAAEHHGYEHGIGTLDFGEGDQADADREFVLNAHEDMGALLAEVDRRTVALEAAISQCAKAEDERDKHKQSAEIANAELETLRGGFREIGGNPTQVQNLYAQLSLRGRQREEAKAEADRLRAERDRHRTAWQSARRRANELATELGGRDEDARERWIQQQEQQLGLKYADFRAGRWEMDLAMGREMAAAYVAMAKTLLGDAPNYSETKLEFDVKIAEQPELYTLVVQRHAPDALTPHEARQRAEAERDGAYRERAQLLAWLATTHPAVLAPAPDVDEPGWQILYLTAGGHQLSWHIHPRDAELFAHVEQVAASDPRAQWDGHTTDEKYQRIQTLTAGQLHGNTDAQHRADLIDFAMKAGAEAGRLVAERDEARSALEDAEAERDQALAERAEAAQLSHQYRNERDRLASQLDAARAVREQWAEHCLGPQTRALLADLDTALAPPADAPSTTS